MELPEAPEDMGTAQNVSIPASSETDAGAPETEPAENVSATASPEDNAGPAPAAGFEAVPRIVANTPSTDSDLSLSEWSVAGINYKVALRTREIIQGFIRTIRAVMHTRQRDETENGRDISRMRGTFQEFSRLSEFSARFLGTPPATN
jgi:hypothetical protein